MLIKKLRQENKMSLEEMSRVLDWSVSKLQRIENGNQAVTLEDLEAMAKVFNITISELIGEKPISSTQLEGKDFRSCVIDILNKYHQQTKLPFKNNSYNTLLTKDITMSLSELANINPKKYLVTGSAGKGNFAEIPWVAVFDRDITETATEGIYVVYLFAHDMSGVYLTLNNGFTFFDREFKEREGLKQVTEVADNLREICNTFSTRFNLSKIDLKAKGKLAKGYTAGNIMAKYYSATDIPSNEELRDDLQELLAVYKKLVGIKGNRTNEEFYRYIISENHQLILTDEEFDEKLSNSINIVETNKERAGYPDRENIYPKGKQPIVKDSKGREYYPRIPWISANALRLANYLCEYDPTQKTFIRRSNGKPYTEPHHLIPLSKHNDFIYSLDVESNIVSVSSEVHNCLHYGVDEARVKILKKLYNDRSEMLRKAGLEITFEKLKEYYGIIL